MMLTSFDRLYTKLRWIWNKRCFPVQLNYQKLSATNSGKHICWLAAVDTHKLSVNKLFKTDLLQLPQKIPKPNQPKFNPRKNKITNPDIKSKNY